MNPEDKKLWFRAKRYGWGWGVPRTWEGWMVILFYAAAVTALASMTLGDNKSTPADVFMFIAGMTVFTAILVAICYKKGEQPRWRWGK